MAITTIVWLICCTVYTMSAAKRKGTINQAQLKIHYLVDIETDRQTDRSATALSDSMANFNQKLLDTITSINCIEGDIFTARENCHLLAKNWLHSKGANIS